MNERRKYRPRSTSYAGKIASAKRTALLCLFAFLTTAMLLENEASLELSTTALNLWFQKMIPALLPFMILSGILIRMNLSDRFAGLFSPILRPVFRLSDSCLYVIVIGFLCGFPMGARVTAESYERKKISRREAELLLAFCNNIGPIYFTGFVLLLFPVENPWPYLAGMYLLPLLYGIWLRYAVYRDIPICTGNGNKGAAAGKDGTPLRAASSSWNAENGGDKSTGNGHTKRNGGRNTVSLLEQMQASITSALTAIASLGGYMILFNLMNLIPGLLLPREAVLLKALAGCLLEITSGLARLPGQDAFWAFVLLPFGGLSCIAQTYSMIRETDLSLNQYVLHKCVQTGIAFVYYTVLWRW